MTLRQFLPRLLGAALVVCMWLVAAQMGRVCL